MIRSKAKTVRKPSRAQMVKALDDAAKVRVFLRDGGICLRCRVNGRHVQWSHVFGKRHKYLRWDDDNAMTLCAGCHMFWHEYPTESGEWFRRNWPWRYEHLHSRWVRGSQKFSVEEAYKELERE